MASPEPFASIHIDLPHNEFERKFDTKEDLSTWAREEVRFWIDQVPRMRQAARTLRLSESIIPEQAAPALNVLIHTIDRTGSGEPTEVLQQVKNLEDAIRNGVALIRGSTLGDRFIAALETHPDVAAVAYLIGPGLSNAPEIQTVSLGQQPLWRLINAYRLRFPATLEEVDVRSGSLAARQEEFIKATQQLNEVMAELQRLRDTLERQLKLAAPTTYWSKLSSDQAGWMLAMFALIVALLIGGGWAYLGYYLPEALPKIASAMLAIEGDKANSMAQLVRDAPLFTFLAASGPLLVLLWLLRYPSKLFMQGVGLKADADHRVAMTQAYLALTKEPGLVKTERETEMILQALFRPGPADAADVTPHESFMSALGQVIHKK